MKSIRTILTAFSPVDVAVIVLAVAAAHCSLAHGDEYYYAEVSVGHFFKGDYRSTTPDGQLPATAKLGKAWDLGDWMYFAEIRHRSNLDLGWPINHKSEYSRSGLFAGARYTWGRR